MQPAPIPIHSPESTIKRDKALLVFTRTPTPGQVKNRLLSVMDSQQATAIQVELLQRTLDTARRSIADHIELWCAPTTQHPVLRDLGRRFSLTLHTQEGGNLGERMCGALEQALQRYRHVALVGSDCIDLVTADIDLALEQLAAGTDVVLGPALDGGYYLVGLSRSCGQLFAGIEWGADTVLQDTRARVAQSGLTLYELPLRRDLDRPGDLRYFRQM